MNEELKQLIADARIALENIESHPSNIYRNASASWLLSIAQSIQAHSEVNIEELRAQKP